MEIFISITFLKDSILLLLVIDINIPNVNFTIASTTCQNQRIVWVKCERCDTIWDIDVDCGFHWIEIPSEDAENRNNALMLTP